MLRPNVLARSSLFLALILCGCGGNTPTETSQAPAKPGEVQVVTEKAPPIEKAPVQKTYIPQTIENPPASTTPATPPKPDAPLTTVDHSLSTPGKQTTAYTSVTGIDFKNSPAGDWNEKGSALMTQNRLEEALAMFDAGIKADPKHPASYLNKGYTLHCMKQYDKAIQCFDMCLKLDPNEFMAWNNKGNTLNNTKKYTEAIACFDKAIALKSDNSQVYYNKAISCKGLERWEECVAACDKALQYAPEHSGTWWFKGVGLKALKKYDGAAAAFGKVTELERENPRAIAMSWYNKGDCLHYLGKFDDAIVAFDKAIALNPSYSDAKLGKEACRKHEAHK